MRLNRLLLSVAVLSSAGLGACGTITQGGTQTVDVVVKGSPTAFCEFTTSRFRNAGHFPNKVVLERSREDLKADCRGEQNRHVAFTVPTSMTAAGTAGNVPTGILPGMGYDLGTGGMWAYPDPLIVDFRTVGEGPKPEWPENKADADYDPTRVGTAPIAPPLPVRMQPVMDEQLDPAMFEPAPESSGGTEVIDAVRLAVDGKPVAITKTTTTLAPSRDAVKMEPIASPEDRMGLNPGAVKAKAEAERKAREDAKRKAAEEAAAAKRAAEEAKAAQAAAAKAAAEAKASEEAAAKAAAGAQAAQPAAESAATAATPAETPAQDSATQAPAAEAPAETPPSDADLTPPSSQTPEAAPAATTTTTTTTTTAPADSAATPPADASAPAEPSATTTTTTTTTTTPAEEPAEPGQNGEGGENDMDKYLEGGQ